MVSFAVISDDRGFSASRWPHVTMFTSLASNLCCHPPMFAHSFLVDFHFPGCVWGNVVPDCRVDQNHLSPCLYLCLCTQPEDPYKLELLIPPVQQLGFPCSPLSLSGPDCCFWARRHSQDHLVTRRALVLVRPRILSSNILFSLKHICYLIHSENIIVKSQKLVLAVYSVTLDEAV